MTISLYDRCARCGRPLPSPRPPGASDRCTSCRKPPQAAPPPTITIDGGHLFVAGMAFAILWLIQMAGLRLLLIGFLLFALRKLAVSAGRAIGFAIWHAITGSK